MAHLIILSDEIIKEMHKYEHSIILVSKSYADRHKLEYNDILFKDQEPTQLDLWFVVTVADKEKAKMSAWIKKLRKEQKLKREENDRVRTWNI